MDHKYRFNKDNHGEDEEYPQVTIVYSEDLGDHGHFSIEAQPDVKDKNKSADEGAKLYKNTVIEVKEEIE